jgi:glycosyltransferase involved in cell wall biosynthesis
MKSYEIINSNRKNIKISVGIVTYNQEKYIAQSVEGVLNQKTNYSFEILIADDFSTDNTRNIILNYQKSYPDNIFLLLQKKNVGGRKNFIDLIKNLNGEYIALCDGDDYWTDPYKLQKQVDYLESHPDFAMCSHEVKIIYDEVEERNPFVEPLKISNFDDIVTQGHFVPSLSMVFRKKALPKIPSWFNDLWVLDIPLVHLITHYGKNYYMGEIMGIKRKNIGSVSRQPHRISKEYKEYSVINRLFYYRNLNKFFNYQHKKVLNPIIAQYYLNVMYINFQNKKYVKALINIINALYHSPKIFFKCKIYKTFINLSKAKGI